MEMIRDTKKLNSSVTKFAASHKKHMETAHILVVSAIAHAAEHGDPRVLTTLYEAFTTNEQTSLRQYLSFIHRDYPDTKFLGFRSAKEGQKAGFTVAKDTAEQRAAMIRLAEETLLENYPRFYERNNIDSMRELSNAQFLTKVKAILKQARGESEKVTSKVSPEYIRVLSSTVETLENMKAVNLPTVEVERVAA